MPPTAVNAKKKKKSVLILTSVIKGMYKNKTLLLIKESDCYREICIFV